MTDIAQCAKCAYKIELPHSDFIKMFYEQHNCETTLLQKAIARVRQLHTPDKSDWNDGFNPCPSCGDYGQIQYPCPTIQALDGEQ